MAVLFDRNSGTSVNIDSDVAKRSNTTFTAARKFSAPDSSLLESNTGMSVSNDTLVIEHIAAMNGVSSTVDKMVEMATANLLTTRDALSYVPGESDINVRELPSSITEAEVLDTKDSLVKAYDEGQRDTASDLFRKTTDSVFTNSSQKLTPSSFNSATPQIESVSVDLDKLKGTVDCFYASIRFSLPLADVLNGNLKAIRIFRSTVLYPKFQRGTPPTLSLHAMELLSSLRMRSRIKNDNFLSSLEKRFLESGLANSLSVLNPIDAETNARIATNQNDTFVEPETRSFGSQSSVDVSADVSSFLDDRYSNLDKSVANDLNSIRNIRNQDFSSARPTLQNFVATDLTGDSRTSLVVDKNNPFQFREICFVALDKLKSSVVGDRVEYTFFDDSVSFGRGYKYFITSVDKNMIESVRSHMIDIVVEGIRVPERPKRVFAYNVNNSVALNILVDDKLVEKFEIFRKDATNPAIKPESITVRNISNAQGFTSSESVSSILGNGFIKIGESLNGAHGAGSTFADRTALPGRKYIYRIYSVDIFSNKSESPYEQEFFLKQNSVKQNDLIKPSMTTEIDAETNKVRITFKCEDKRVVSLMLARKDLTIHQLAFTSPGQVNSIKMGVGNALEGSRKFEDVIFRGDTKDSSWNGRFDNTGETIVFIDKSVSLDHTYQYSIYGLDKFGNKTSHEISKPLLVMRRAMINAPVNISAEVVQGPEFSVGGIKISWQDGNVDITAEDRLGNRDSLESTSVRTLYQVERKRYGDEQWIEFPLIEDKVFFDPTPTVQGDDTPKFRPPLVQQNEKYSYRIRAVQTGSYISNYSNFIDVTAMLPVLAPENFRLKNGDPRVKPFYIVLNWDTPADSGVVDKWIIERAEINNFAASNMNMRDPNEISSLSWISFRTVNKESSRFRSQDSDGTEAVSQIFSGDHHFQDTDVRMGNTYFYRIKSISIDNRSSPWVYRAMKLTEQSFQQKIEKLIKPEVKRTLSKMPVPLNIFGSLDGMRTLSMQPSFSNPSVIPSVEPSVSLDSVRAILSPTPLATYQTMSSISNLSLTTTILRNTKLR